MTLQQFRLFAAENKIEWAPVLAPRAVFESVQAVACGAMGKDEHGSWWIMSPAQFGESDVAGTLLPNQMSTQIHLPRGQPHGVPPRARL